MIHASDSPAGLASLGLSRKWNLPETPHREILGRHAMHDAPQPRIPNNSFPSWRASRNRAFVDEEKISEELQGDTELSIYVGMQNACITTEIYVGGIVVPPGTLLCRKGETT